MSLIHGKSPITMMHSYTLHVITYNVDNYYAILLLSYTLNLGKIVTFITHGEKSPES